MPVSIKDFNDKKKAIEVSITYELNNKELKEVVSDALGVDDVEISKGAERDIIFRIKFDPSTLVRDVRYEIVPEIGVPSIELNEIMTAKNIYRPQHKAVFWTADSKYLINDPINLASFAKSPKNVSIPLRNCFLLAGITDISECINSLKNDTTEIEYLETTLGNKVTEHIRKVWPNHPVTITFKINSGEINFHVKDNDGVGKSKTADQRSDGFRQFISFLLTISAENTNAELTNTIILLDEPETHLHPHAQIELLKELIEITNNDRGNIVLFGTHSNYMIDKNNLTRNIRVEKKNQQSVLDQLNLKDSTYAGINYHVFGILSVEYFIELYSKHYVNYLEGIEGKDDKNKKPSQLSFDNNFFHILHGNEKKRPYKETQDAVTEFTYIRNCIHHPENKNKYTEKELKISIEKMIEYL